MFGAMTSLTGGGALHGGSAGPSSAANYTTTNNSMGFTAASYSFGSNNGLPSWFWVAAAVAAGVYVIKRK